MGVSYARLRLKWPINVMDRLRVMVSPDDATRLLGDKVQKIPLIVHIWPEVLCDF